MFIQYVLCYCYSFTLNYCKMTHCILVSTKLQLWFWLVNNCTAHNCTHNCTYLRTDLCIGYAAKALIGWWQRCHWCLLLVTGKALIGWWLAAMFKRFTILFTITPLYRFGCNLDWRWTLPWIIIRSRKPLLVRAAAAWVLTLSSYNGKYDFLRKQHL